MIKYFVLPEGKKVEQIPKGRILKKCGKELYEPIYIRENTTISSEIKSIPPKKIHNKLNKIIHGNYKLKKTLSIVLSKLIARIKNPQIEIPKSNMLILGETGTGKTLLIDSLSKIINVPLIKSKLTAISSTGYVGNSIEDVFENLLDVEYMPISNAEYAIVHLDEIDKIAKGVGKLGGFSNNIQDELIGYLEEYDLFHSGLSTKNMLFIGTGAFSGLEKIISSRLKNKNSKVGFTSKSINKESKSYLLSKVIFEDLIEYGFKPELVARFPFIGNTTPITEKSFVSIMDLKSSYLNKQIKLIKNQYDIKIEFTNGAKNQIAKRAIEKGTNARAIQSLVDSLFEEVLYSPEECGKKVIFNKEYVKEIFEKE